MVVYRSLLVVYFQRSTINHERFYLLGGARMRSYGLRHVQRRSFGTQQATVFPRWINLVDFPWLPAKWTTVIRGLHSRGTNWLVRVSRYGMASAWPTKERTRFAARIIAPRRRPRIPPMTGERFPARSRPITRPINRPGVRHSPSRCRLPSPCVTKPFSSRPTIRCVITLQPQAKATTSPTCRESNGTAETQRQSPFSMVPRMLQPRQGSE